MMNPYICECTCDVCGEGGVTTISNQADRWLGGTLSHSNPEVCARNLRRKKEELDKKEKELKNKY